MITRKPLHKLLSLLLALLLLPMAAPPQTAHAAMPTSAAGEAWDGVDFAALTAPGSGIYYGKYEHATSLFSTWHGEPTYREGIETPVLWRVMGEENNDNTIALMSEYVLDTKNFHNAKDKGANYYYDSDIRAWLKGAFMDSFNDAENEGMSAADVVTGMYLYDTDEEKTGQYTTTSAGDAHTYANDLPWTETGDKVYLPWGMGHARSVYWTAGNDAGVGKLSNSHSDNIGKLKNGTPVYWWLRSPDSNISYDVLHIGSDGGVYRTDVSDILGVRPAFKLNPESVIFTSEIKTDADTAKGETEADATNYAVAASTGATNYKLTVVDSSLSLTGATANSETVDASNHPIIIAAPGGTVSIAGTGTDGTKLTYKIVANNGGTREIAGYGQSADNTSLTVDAKDLDGVNLADGDYTVYVWAQKNELINSNTGSAPLWFTLNVPDTTAPTITDVAPSGAGVDINGNITITFSESMDPSVGTVSLDDGSTTLDTTGASWNDTNTIYTIPYFGLTWSTAYAITISGFEDAAGNAINPDPDTSHTFTTKAQPDGPDVSPTTLNLDLNGNPTGTLTVSLGQSGNQAAEAVIAVDSAYTGDISVSIDSLNADGTVTVTGLGEVTGATVTVTFSGGDLTTPISIPVTVNVTDSTAPAPPLKPARFTEQEQAKSIYIPGGAIRENMLAVSAFIGDRALQYALCHDGRIVAYLDNNPFAYARNLIAGAKPYAYSGATRIDTFEIYIPLPLPADIESALIAMGATRIDLEGKSYLRLFY